MLLLDPCLASVGEGFGYNFPWKGVIFTSSPDLKHYKEYEKNKAVSLFLPCPSEEEVLAMGDVILPGQRDVLSKDVDEVGPFPRVIFGRKTDKFVQDRKAALDEMSVGQLVKIAATIERREDSLIPITSHRILKMDSDPMLEDQTERFLVTKKVLNPASKAVVEDLTKRLEEKTADDLLEDLHSILTCRHPVGGLGREISYQSLVAKLLKRGDQAYHTAFTFHQDDTENAVEDSKKEWVPLELPAFTCMESSQVRWVDMEENVLYEPFNPSYPFADLMWRVGDVLYATQVHSSSVVVLCQNLMFVGLLKVTVSDIHPKSFSTFNTKWLKQELGVSWDDGVSSPEHIHFFYTLLPHVAEKKRQIEKMPRSFAWKPASDATKVMEMPVTFGLLMPERFMAIAAQSQKSLVMEYGN